MMHAVKVDPYSIVNVRLFGHISLERNLYSLHLKQGIMSAFRKDMKVFDVHIQKNRNEIAAAMETLSIYFL